MTANGAQGDDYVRATEPCPLDDCMVWESFLNKIVNFLNASKEGSSREEGEEGVEEQE